MDENCPLIWNVYALNINVESLIHAPFLVYANYIYIKGKNLCETFGKKERESIFFILRECGA